MEELCYCGGKLQKEFILYYTNPKSGTNGKIHFPTGKKTELQKLKESCDIAYFGKGTSCVVDPEYRKSYFLDSNNFSCSFHPNDANLEEVIKKHLLPAKQKCNIHMEVYHLNFYEEGNFFNIHRDTPSSPEMFGTLVICLPTLFSGGTLMLQPNRDEIVPIKWDIESSSHLQWVAFFGDIPHRVEEVTSGTRITITYKLYFSKDTEGPNFVSFPTIIHPNKIKEIQDKLDHWVYKDTKIQRISWGCKYMYSNSPKKCDGRFLKGFDSTLYATLTQAGYDPKVMAMIADSEDWNEEKIEFECDLCERLNTNTNEFITTCNLFFCDTSCAKNYVLNNQDSDHFSIDDSGRNDFCCQLYDADDAKVTERLPIKCHEEYSNESDFLLQYFTKPPLTLWMNNPLNGECSLGASAQFVFGNHPASESNFYMYHAIYIDLAQLRREKISGIRILRYCQ